MVLWINPVKQQLSTNYPAKKFSKKPERFTLFHETLAIVMESLSDRLPESKHLKMSTASRPFDLVLEIFK